MHALEKPLILVSVFKFIAANFDHKLSSTVYLLVLFVASIATAIYSPLAGYLYDTIGFANTYLILGSVAGLFTLISIFTLQDKREPKKRRHPPQPLTRRNKSLPGSHAGLGCAHGLSERVPPLCSGACGIRSGGGGRKDRSGRFFTINRDGAILFFAKICRIPALTIPIIEHFLSYEQCHASAENRLRLLGCPKTSWTQSVS